MPFSAQQRSKIAQSLLSIADNLLQKVATSNSNEQISTLSKVILFFIDVIRDICTETEENFKAKLNALIDNFRKWLSQQQSSELVEISERLKNL